MDYSAKFLTHIVNAGIIPKSSKDLVETNHFKRIQEQSDRSGKRSISYWLRIELDFAYGYAKDFKTGIETRFNSARDDKNMTRADVARIKAMMKARQAQEAVEIAKRHEKIADRAKRIWQKLSYSMTPYCLKKGITGASARAIGENLWIPIYDADDLVSWQVIRPDGVKRFPFGGKKQGCYHIIGQINPLERFVICEGFATGESIHNATGLAVAVAFDAGNLIHVAKKLRAKYKNTPITIAADNDQSQTGQKAANAVLKSVQNSNMIMPETIGHDFNDLTPEEIKKAFGIGQSREGSPDDDLQSSSVSFPADWQNCLITDGKNRIVSSSLQNAILYLLNHDDFKGVFAYDEFKQAIIIKKCPPWEFEQKFKVKRISDVSITQASATLESYGLSCAIDKTAKAIEVVAHENAFHSARLYFDTLEWDNVPRLETFLKQYCGAESEHPDYLSAIFKKWMTAAVKRIYEPACKFDHVLILESTKQGLYKSELLKELATFNGERYHTDGVTISQIVQKDTVIKLQGNLIVELAELSGFSKQEDEIIKNWITQTVDEVRLPFSREVSKFSRQFVFAATTNNTDYLKDPSGNRRFWPVTIEKVIDIKAVSEIKSQLWAEAIFLYKQGIYIGLTENENNLAEIERNKRFITDAWDEIVIGIVENLGIDEFKTSDILAKMDLKTNDKNERANKRISSILKSNGYENVPRWDNKLKKSVRVWCKNV